MKSNDSFTRMETEYLPPGHDPELPSQTRVGPYEVVSVLGHGGMGVVYKAKVRESCSVAVGQIVALKMLHEVRLDSLERRRFHREATYLQALRHPGIVRVLDIGEHHGRPFLVMQYIEGQTLDQILNQQVARHGARFLPEEPLCDYMIQALEALHTAHLGGILHRDLKPGNFMLTAKGQVKLLDFGMAQRLDSDSRLTATGSVLGTPAYMSPEQARGARDDVNHRSDIYSMGAVAYELVTGQQPHTAENSIAVLRRILEDPLRPPSLLRPAMHRDLETVILKAMAKDPRDRYANAEAMADDLRRLRGGMRVRARRLGRLIPLARALWSRRRMVTGIALVVFLATSGIALTIRSMVRYIATIESGREDEDDLHERLQAEWRTKWQHHGYFDWHTSPLPRTEKALSGTMMELVSLPEVTNENVRLSVTITPVDDHEPIVELMICDGDIGQGYGLRLVGEDDQLHLSLLRGNPGLGSTDRSLVSTAIIPSRFPARLTLAKEHDTVTIMVDDEEAIAPFRDPVPIDGPWNNRVHVAVLPDSVNLSHITLERQRKPELVSRMETADIMRQERRYHRAIQLYRQFLDDFPNHPLRRDALYRIGLCQSALGDENPDELRRALRTFQDLIDESQDDRYYYKISTSQAWIVAGRLGLYQLAEQYFDSLRQRFQLKHLLASIPKTDLLDLLRNYIARAEDSSLQRDNPHRALQLLQTGAEFAEYLEENDYYVICRLGIGDLHLGLSDMATAMEHYRQIVERDDLNAAERQQALLRIAHATRLQDHHHGFYDNTLAAYGAVLSFPDGTRTAQAWARLWLGELHAHLGDIQQAIIIWRGNHDNRSLPGRLINHMLRSRTAFAARDDDAGHAITIDFFNAIVLKMRSDHPSTGAADRRLLLRQVRNALGSIVVMHPSHRWPAPLAQIYLREIEDEFPSLPSIEDDSR